MKKILSIVSLMFLLCTLVGCDIYYDTSKRDMELIEIKVYDEEGVEIVGEYENYFRELNSAAPVVNFLFVDIDPSQTYYVDFIFISKKKYEMNKLKIANVNNPYEDVIECTDILKEDGKIIARQAFSNFSETYRVFRIWSWYLSNTEKRFNTKGSNTYILGVVFNFDMGSSI